MKKRVFIGIKASKNLQNKIAKWQKANKNLPVRFIKPKNLHLTLIPPWYEENFQDIKSQIAKVEFEKFTINFSAVYINFNNRVIWTETSKPPKAIFKLQKNLATIFRKYEERPFKVHLTIARFKDAKPLKDVNFEKIKWQEKVSKITLFESILGKKEANYKVL